LLNTSLIYAGILLVLALIQKFLFNKLAVYGLVPDVVLIFVIFLSRREGQLFGTAAGFLCGLVTDLVLGTLGVGSFSKTAAGFTAGYFEKKESRNEELQFLICVAVTSLVHNFCYTLIANGGSVPFIKLILLYTLLGSVYNLLLAYLAYHLVLRRV